MNKEEREITLKLENRLHQLDNWSELITSLIDKQYPIMDPHTLEQLEAELADLKSLAAGALSDEDVEKRWQALLACDSCEFLQNDEIADVKPFPGLFSTGYVTISQLAQYAGGMEFYSPYLERHVSGDWGDVDEETRRLNEVNLFTNGQLTSLYVTPDFTFTIVTARGEYLFVAEKQS